MSTQASSWNRRSKPRDLQINVFNRQRGFPIDRKELVRFLGVLSARLQVRSPFAVVLVSDRAMRRFNRKFAGRDKTTDVLSFPAGAGEEGGESCLGDVIISVEAADRQSPDDLAAEVKRLALHGLLHLLGYDHVSDTGRMKRLETKLRGEFGLT